MLKIQFNFLPLVIFGLITSSSPVHAGSFFDSIGKNFTGINQQVSDRIKEYYEDDSQTNSYPEVISTKVKIQTPIASIGPDFAQCKFFLGLMYNPYYESDPKTTAAIYLNASLDFSSLRIDAKLSSEEIA